MIELMPEEEDATVEVLGLREVLVRSIRNQEIANATSCGGYDTWILPQ